MAGAKGKSGVKGPILIVRTGEPVPTVRERRGEFHDMIQRAIGDAWSGPYDVIDVRDEGAPLPAPDAAAAFVITGSAANVHTREPWMLRTEAWLRDLVGAGAPVFGICFGHQILAQALGGEVQANPSGREMGTVSLQRLDHAPIFDGLPERFDVNVTHLDTVVRLPPGMRTLAYSRLEDNHVIRFAEACYGVQFHPEIDGEVMTAYIESRKEALISEGFRVDEMLEGVHDARWGRQTIQNFVRHHVR